MFNENRSCIEITLLICGNSSLSFNENRSCIEINTPDKDWEKAWSLMKTEVVLKCLHMRKHFPQKSV